MPCSWIEELSRRAETSSEAIKQEAASFGTAVHAAVDAIIKAQGLPGVKAGADGDAGTSTASTGLDPSTEAAVAGHIARFRQWQQQSGMKLASAGDTVIYRCEVAHFSACKV